MLQVKSNGSIRGNPASDFHEIMNHGRNLATVVPNANCVPADFVCTANDFQVDRVEIKQLDNQTEAPFTCERGDVIEVVIDYLEVTSRNLRYDIGVLFSTTNEAVNSGGSDCTSVVFDNNELLDLESKERNKDPCGDITVDIDRITVATNDTITIICDTFFDENTPANITDQDVYVPYCGTWNIKEGDICVQNGQDPVAIAGTKSKCNCGGVLFNIFIPDTLAPSVSSDPSASPSDFPSDSPTAYPSESPSESPTKSPTTTPSQSPSSAPSASPSSCTQVECDLDDLFFPCLSDLANSPNETDVTKIIVGGVIPAGACAPEITGTFLELTQDGTACPDNPTIYTRTYTITDSSNNMVPCPQIITISNNFTPSFEAEFPPLERTLNCTDIGSFPDPPVVTDSCGDMVTNITTDCCFRIEGAELFLDRKWLAVDKCGNTNSSVQENPVDVQCSVLP